MQPLDTKQLDYVYSLPYERWYPKCYESLGGVPVSTRYCFQLHTTVVVSVLVISAHSHFIRAER